MRIFGSLFNIFKFNRYQLCHSARGRHSTRCPILFNPRPAKYENIRTIVEPQSTRAKSDSTNEVIKSTADTTLQGLAHNVSGKNLPNSFVAANDKSGNILPVALISSHVPNTATNVKILVIPINLFKGDDQELQNTFRCLETIRNNASLIESFSESFVPPSENKTKTEVKAILPPRMEAAPLIDRKPVIESKDMQKYNDVPFWQSTLNDFDATHDDDVPLFDNLDRIAKSENEIKDIELRNSFDEVEWNNSKRKLLAYLPDKMRKKLQQMAISSMQLAFEMNMTNIKDAILMGDKLRELEMYAKPKNVALNDPILSLTTCVELDPPPLSHNTIPLNFNALIQGTIKVDASQFSLEKLCNLQVPDFNDDMTAIAANICSTALQKGFPTDISRMYSTNSSSMLIDTNSDGNFLSQTQTVDCLKQPSKSMSHSSNSDVASRSLIDDTSIRGLMSCNLYAKALAEATKRRQAMKKTKQNKRMADKSKSKPCGPISSHTAKSKSCKPEKSASKASCKSGGKKPEKVCAAPQPKKAEDCKPKKVAKSPCGTDNKDPCGKKKKDPCGEKKKAPCAEKKKSPCGEKKKDPCSKKKSPCGEKKKDPCSKKKSPCGEKKEDPCAKKKKDKCGDKKPKGGSEKCNTADPCKTLKDKPKTNKCNSSDPCKKPEKKCAPKEDKSDTKCPSPTNSRKSRADYSTAWLERKTKSCEKSSNSKCRSESKSSCAPKKSTSKCSTRSSSTPKCAPKKSTSKCRSESKSKCAPKKSTSKCRSESKSKCAPKKSSSASGSKSSPIAKCGAKPSDTAPKCKSKKSSCKPSKPKSPCKKSYSTTTLLENFDEFVPQNRTITTAAKVLWRRAFSSSLNSFRFYGSKKSKGDDEDLAHAGRCNSAGVKIPKKRWNVCYKKNKDCWASDTNDCPKVACKDPKKSNCKQMSKKSKKCKKSKKGPCQSNKPGRK